MAGFKRVRCVQCTKLYKFDYMNQVFKQNCSCDISIPTEMTKEELLEASLKREKAEYDAFEELTK